jgi:hypothetical protein
MCREVADVIEAAGFSVYLSANGEYGIFTDAKEKVVVSFSNFSVVARFYGSYLSKRVGSGWGIDDVYPLTEEKVRDVFKDAHCPPVWAVGTERVTLCTLRQHLARYELSSGFVKLGAQVEETERD